MCALAEARIQCVAKSINNDNQKTCTVLASSQNLALLDLSNLQTEEINHYHMLLSIFQKIIASHFSFHPWARFKHSELNNVSATSSAFDAT